jgi:hypothetical protein
VNITEHAKIGDLCYEGQLEGILLNNAYLLFILFFFPIHDSSL